MENRHEDREISSGAEKVEAIGKEQAHTLTAEELMREARAEERAAADARVEAAVARSAKKEASRLKGEARREIGQEARAREKQAEKRAAAHTERAAGKAARAARREMERAEQPSRAQAARSGREKSARRQEKAARRAEKRARKQQGGQGGGKKRAPGIGGWIAAVSVLGAACLALTAAVTVGAFRMSALSMRAANESRATLYELVSVSEDLDDNFAKLRVASGAGEQRVLLTDILVDAAIMESAIERIPVDAATGTDMSAFVNHTGMFARAMLRRLASGGTLTERERGGAAALCETNAKLCKELSELALHTPAAELERFFSGGEGAVRRRFAEIGQGLHGEREITDAPFAGEGNVGENALGRETEITAADAEKRVRTAFEGYHLKDVRMTGETVARDVKAYNFLLRDEGGTEFFVQISKSGGKILFFDSFEACMQHNFSLENCDELARDFLAKLGYEGLTPVWFSDSGNVASITYVAERAGVRIYPDMIRVRVCEEKGRVVGMDAHAYAVNHHGKRETSPTLSEPAARGRLSAELACGAGKLALIPHAGREVLTYEFDCRSGEERFLVYVDAHSGEEVRIFRVHESAQGSYLS